MVYKFTRNGPDILQYDYQLLYIFLNLYPFTIQSRLLKESWKRILMRKIVGKNSFSFSYNIFYSFRDQSQFAKKWFFSASVSHLNKSRIL